MLRTIAALCVSGRSIYKHMDGVVAYDAARDARTFPGGMPVIAHPPCRCWSKYLSHQAKPPDRNAEMDLGRWCVEQVLKNGGVLEHPAHSRLFEACQLPRPNSPDADPFLYTVYLEQSWFGYRTRKPTWVLVCGVPKRSMPPLPFGFAKSAGPFDMGGLSQAARSRTMGNLADWLCQTARATWWNLPMRPPEWQMPKAAAKPTVPSLLVEA